MGRDSFNDWFAKNHPLDWWASERAGEPLPHSDRLLVASLCRSAFEQALRNERERAAKIADEWIGVPGIQNRAFVARRIAAAIRKDD